LELHGPAGHRKKGIFCPTTAAGLPAPAAAELTTALDPHRRSISRRFAEIEGFHPLAVAPGEIQISSLVSQVSTRHRVVIVPDGNLHKDVRGFGL
jgi:hypothetical protein